jgi:hypothetical protein
MNFLMIGHLLNQSSSPKRPFKSIDTFDDTDFETYDDIPSMDDDDDQSDKFMWISADVQDDGPQYIDKKFSHTKTILECFHA